MIVLLLAAIGVFLAYRAFRQHEAAAATAIKTPNGIQEAGFIHVGNRQEWISIRGTNRDNPVLLMIDGGPGAASSVFVPYRWEDIFTIVEWDQPGAGRSFAKAGRVIDPHLSIEDVARDGILVADYLRHHLHKDKIGLFASSWGSIVGIEMAKMRPDLFYAYVGTGQTVNLQGGETLNYAHVLAKAKARGDAKAIAELEKSGAPPYHSQTQLRTQRKWAARYEAGSPDTGGFIWSLLFAPNYSLLDVRDWIMAFLASQDHFFGKAMNGPLMSVDLPSLGTDFAVPIFMFQGTQDDYAPFSLAKNYFESIRAPQKLFVAAQGAGHYAAYSHPQQIRQLLVDHVRPLGVAADAEASSPALTARQPSSRSNDSSTSHAP